MIILRGRVVSGLGEGAKYVELYREQIRRVLGFDPYPGTLNIEVFGEKHNPLPFNKAIIIPPPTTGYGKVYAFKAYLMNEKVYVVKPEITKHSWRIIEVISEHNLRKRLGLKDGSIVELLIMV